MAGHKYTNANTEWALSLAFLIPGSYGPSSGPGSFFERRSALKFLSHVWSAVSGSINGITYFNGRYGFMIARNRSIPTQPNSTPQSKMRTALSNAQALWNLATVAERTAWETYAATVQYTGPIGNYHIGGRERMLGTIALSSYMNNVLGTTIPVSAGAPRGAGWLLLSELDTADPSLPGTGFDLTVGNPNDHAIEVQIQISAAKPITVNFWKGPWETAQSVSLAVPSLSTALKVFDGLEDGLVYFVRVRGVSNSAEHKMSEAFILRVIAGSNP